MKDNPQTKRRRNAVRYYAAKFRGKCGVCQKRPRLPNKTRCQRCTDRQKAKGTQEHAAWRRKKRALGLCSYCGSARPESGSRCEDCKLYHRLHRRYGKIQTLHVPLGTFWFVCKPAEIESAGEWATPQVIARRALEIRGRR